MKKLDTVINCLTLLVAITVVGVLVKREFLPQQPPPAAPLLGQKMKWGGVEWGGARRTVLLVLSTQCGFCTQSAEQLRAVTAAAGKADRVHVIGVFPQEAGAAKQYCEKNGIPLQDIRSVAPGEVGLTATPTVLIVNDRGNVVGSWVGRVSDTTAKQIIRSL